MGYIYSTDVFKKIGRSAAMGANFDLWDLILFDGKMKNPPF